MKKRPAFNAMALAAIGAVVFWAVGPAGSSTGSTRIHLIAHQIGLSPLAGTSTSQNAPPKQGDGFVFNETLTTPSGAAAGHDGVVCVVTSSLSPQGVGELQCTGTAVLAGGQLTATGIINTGSQTSRLAITGGSGVYRNAHGELTVTDINDNTSDFVFTIT